jgi:SAM-dependent methyltransferase
MSREQRLVFGEVAALYDEFRPGYPPEVLDAVLAHSGVPASGSACEVGCGTGKVTILLAARRVDVVAVEPSAEMAAIAAAKCAPYSGVDVQVMSFEDWSPGPQRFALVLAAQSWHWVTAGTRLGKAHDALQSGGSLALLWNQPDWSANPLRREIDDVYERMAPELVARRPGYPLPRVPPDQSAPADELRRSPLFDGLAISEYRWTEHYTARAYKCLLETQSDHRMLPTAQRERLLHAIGAVIADSGGVVPLDYVTELYLARRSAR